VRVGQTSVIHFGSTVTASVVGFAATLYIAQELGSSTLGVYSLFIAVITWMNTGFGHGLHYAVAKRVSEVGDSSRDFGAGLITQAIVFAIVSVILFFFRQQINEYLSFRGTELLFLAFAIILCSSFVTTILQSEQKVHISSILKPIDRIIRSGIQLGVVFFALLGGGVAGLIWGYMIGAAVAMVIGLIFISIRPQFPKREHFESVLGFTRYSWLSAIEARSFSALDTVILGVFVSTNFIGYYEVAWNLASLLAIFGTSISQTLFPAMSELDSREQHDTVRELITDGIAYLGLFLIPGLFGVVIIAEHVLVIYGSEFQRASTVLVVLVAARLVYVYQAQFVTTLNALDYPDRAFRVNLVFIITNLVLNVALVYLFGWFGAAVATGIATAIGLVLSFHALRGVIEFKLPLREILNQLIAAISMSSVVWLAEPMIIQTDFGSIITALLLVSSGAIAYFLVLVSISERFRTTLKANIGV